MKKLNIGGKIGEMPKNYLIVNINEEADIKHDLNVIPYPFKDNSIDKIYCSNLIEHINISTSAFFEEIYRIMKPYSECIIKIPNYFFIGYRIEYLFGQQPNHLHSGHKKITTFEECKINALNVGLKPLLKLWHFIPFKFYKRSFIIVLRKVT